MATVTKIATGAAVASGVFTNGVWTNEANARVATTDATATGSNTYATVANAGRNKEFASLWPFSFTSTDVPDGASVSAVSVKLQWKNSVNSTNYTLRSAAFDGSDDLTAALLSADPGVSRSPTPTADTDDTYSLTTLPTVAQLRSGIWVRASALQGGTNTGSTFSLDYIQVTVTYTVPTNTNVVPGMASLTASGLAPSVTASANQLVTPSVAALTTTAFASTVTASAHQTVTPGTLGLTSTAFAPTVTVQALGITVTPGAASLATSVFAPSVSATDHKTLIPGTAALSITPDAPIITVTDQKVVIVGKAALSLTSFAPTVTALNPQTVIPAKASLSLTGLAPSIYAGQTFVVGTRGLGLTAFAPTVSVTNSRVVTPAPATLSLSSFAVTVLAPQSVVPGTAAMVLTAFSIGVIVSTPAAEAQPGYAHSSVVGRGASRASITPAAFAGSRSAGNSSSSNSSGSSEGTVT